MYVPAESVVQPASANAHATTPSLAEIFSLLVLIGT